MKLIDQLKQELNKQVQEYWNKVRESEEYLKAIGFITEEVMNKKGRFCKLHEMSYDVAKVLEEDGFFVRYEKYDHQNRFYCLVTFGVPSV